MISLPAAITGGLFFFLSTYSSICNVKKNLDSSLTVAHFFIFLKNLGTDGIGVPVSTYLFFFAVF